MSDLINRALLYENETPYVNEHFTGIGENPYESQPMFSLEQIERQPSVDALEVVRCKDCKYRDKDFCLRLGKLDEEQNSYLLMVNYNDYCKWGEKE